MTAQSSWIINKASNGTIYDWLSVVKQLTLLHSRKCESCLNLESLLFLLFLVLFSAECTAYLSIYRLCCVQFFFFFMSPPTPTRFFFSFKVASGKSHQSGPGTNNTCRNLWSPLKTETQGHRHYTKQTLPFSFPLTKSCRENVLFNQHRYTRSTNATVLDVNTLTVSSGIAWIVDYWIHLIKLFHFFVSFYSWSIHWQILWTEYSRADHILHGNLGFDNHHR